MRMDTSAPSGQSPPNKLEPQFTQKPCAFAFSIHFKQLFTLQQAKLFLSHARLRTNGRSRMFAATIAMTMTGADKRRIDFKTNPAAKTTASDKFLHSKP